jgi:hypothetical protein
VSRVSPSEAGTKIETRSLGQIEVKQVDDSRLNAWYKKKEQEAMSSPVPFSRSTCSAGGRVFAKDVI